MLKSFFRRWHYGIKAKVVDGALVAHIDTSVEPVFLRFDLARLQSVIIDVTSKNGDYELVLVGVGAPAASTVLAKFEVREAADEAAAGLRCALLHGNRTSRFWPAFKITLGVIAALLLLAMIGALVGEGVMSTQSGASLTHSASMMGEPAGMEAPSDPSEPQSAEQFLGGN